MNILVTILLAWLKQPTTIQGIAVLAAGAVHTLLTTYPGLAAVLGGTWPASMTAGAATLIALPDNTTKAASPAPQRTAYPSMTPGNKLPIGLLALLAASALALSACQLTPAQQAALVTDCTALTAAEQADPKLVDPSGKKGRYLVAGQTLMCALANTSTPSTSAVPAVPVTTPASAPSTP